MEMEIELWVIIRDMKRNSYEKPIRVSLLEKKNIFYSFLFYFIMFYIILFLCAGNSPFPLPRYCNRCPLRWDLMFPNNMGVIKHLLIIIPLILNINIININNNILNSLFYYFIFLPFLPYLSVSAASLHPISAASPASPQENSPRTTARKSESEPKRKIQN